MIFLYISILRLKKTKMFINLGNFFLGIFKFARYYINFACKSYLRANKSKKERKKG